MVRITIIWDFYDQCEHTVVEVNVPDSRGSDHYKWSEESEEFPLYF